MKLKEESGQSLLIVLMVAAIIAALAPSLQALTGASIEQMIRRERAAKTRLFIDSLRLQMMDASLCTQMLRGTTLPIGGSSSAALRRVIADVDLKIASDKVLKGGVKIPETNVTLERVALQMTERARRVRNAGPPPVYTFRRITYDWPKSPAPNGFRKYYGELAFAPKDTHWNFNDPSGRIELAVIVDPATMQIHQCHGRKSPAEACELMGGAYDVSGRSPAGLECNPNLACHTHQVGTVRSPATCSGLYRGPEREFYLDLYKPKPVGFLSASDRWYVCTWCNRWTN